jgi:thiol-disulfide isomerase/thioredoxin
MIFRTFDKSNTNIEDIDKYIQEDKDVFILVFMHGCGPCNATRPEWDKIKKVLDKKYSNNNNIVVVDVNKDYLPDLKYIGDVDGFPTIKYISDKGKKVESYESSSISNKDRTVRSFIEWIESKIKTKNSNNMNGGKSSVYNVLKRLTKNKTRKSKKRKSRKSSRSKKSSKSKKRKYYKK